MPLLRVLTFLRHPASFLLALPLVLAAVAPAADKLGEGLAGRLAKFDHVGLRLSADGAISLYLYTPAQQERNLKARTDNEARLAELRVKMGRAVTFEQARALEEEYGRLLDESRSRAGRETYYSLVAVGPDYLEIKPAAGEGRTQLVPLRLIGRIYLPEADVEKPEDAKPADAKPSLPSKP